FILFRNYITEQRAINEYLLTPDELSGLRVTIRRSAFDTNIPDKVYWLKDVESKAVQKWGSLEKVEIEREIKERGEAENYFPVYKKLLFDQVREREKKKEEKLSRETWPVRNLNLKDKGGITGSSGKVVLSAIFINTANFGIKLVACVLTGSHSMFSEAIHSLADTLNQCILAYGIHYSTKNPSKDHPYGYSNMQYVTALISGVGIFCIGSGLSAYHGILGLTNPHQLESISIALGILGVSFISESVTLYLAVQSIRKSAAEKNTTFLEFVWSGWDPCVNVVLLEDLAYCCVMVAGGCMSLSYYTGSHIPDAVGSLVIASLLGSVASFMIYSNSGALVGRSIPDSRLEDINQELEGDIMVRQVYDVKGIDMGNGVVRYKAEIDFDGRALARSYLQKQNIQEILRSIKSVQNEKDAEEFLLKHGENIVDCLGQEVDRIEKNLKTKHPEVRHVDLEVL
ncbi:zinc transporter 9, partial [Eurytemora carolleeae]|uniref:zinc transporter 9 n=1 Tax=Eurytemora carolleeae TaxID=1294199 RepID=UPI000C77609E